MGNGLMTFIDQKTCLEDIFSKNEIVFYNNLEDLSEKIILYKNNHKSRTKIAKKGKQKYFKLFNETKISKYILDKSYGKNNSLF